MAAGEVIGNGNPSGSTFGLSITEKVSFHGVDPVVQQATIADATDAATAITKLNAVIAVLDAYGLTATA
jgi:hypothetical protein